MLVLHDSPDTLHIMQLLHVAQGGLPTVGFGCVCGVQRNTVLRRDSKAYPLIVIRYASRNNMITVTVKRPVLIKHNITFHFDTDALSNVKTKPLASVYFYPHIILATTAHYA